MCREAAHVLTMTTGTLPRWRGKRGTVTLLLLRYDDGDLEGQASLQREVGHTKPKSRLRSSVRRHSDPIRPAFWRHNVQRVSSVCAIVAPKRELLRDAVRPASQLNLRAVVFSWVGACAT